MVVDQSADGLELPVVELGLRAPDEGAEAGEGICCSGHGAIVSGTPDARSPPMTSVENGRRVCSVEKTAQIRARTRLRCDARIPPSNADTTMTSPITAAPSAQAEPGVSAAIQSAASRTRSADART